MTRFVARPNPESRFCLDLITRNEQDLVLDLIAKTPNTRWPDSWRGRRPSLVSLRRFSTVFDYFGRFCIKYK